MKTRPQALLARLADTLGVGFARGARVVSGSGAPSFAVPRRCGGRRLALAAAGLAVVSAAAMILPTASAVAGTATDRPLLFTFNGSDTTAGTFQALESLGIDQATGHVYAMDRGADVIAKFNPDGTAANFSATGTSSLTGAGTPQGAFSLNTAGDISVDNSGGPTQGQIYVNREFGPVNAFDSNGNYLWQLAGSLFQDDCGTAVDVDGHLWVGEYGRIQATEFDNTGSPPAQIGSVPSTTGRPCRLNLDASGNLYMNIWVGKVDKYVGGAFSTTVDSGSNRDVAIDQSSASGHIFTIHSTDFAEYDASGTPVGTFGVGTIGNGRGIAYNSALDRVYVADASSKTVEVFGPKVTGTVPDVTIDPPSSVGVSSAHFTGTVNPQGVNNSYHFEWKKGTGSTWGGAAFSPSQTLPADSSDHPVAFDTNNLRGNTTYQVRLVGVNTDSGLRAISSPQTFTTQTAPAPPDVTISPTTGITATTATVQGTINPKGDTADWRVQLSTDPTCSSGFSNKPLQTIGEASTTPVPVGFDLQGLIPGQNYCARISATNSAGTTLSAVDQFATQEIPPDQVQTLPAAPRTDTSARLNARVNPQRAQLTYHFDYSVDDGATWISLPEVTRPDDDTGIQIVVAQELPGLSPGTTYRYRFFASNAAGPADPQGGELTFTTRTTAEVTLPDRGIELVNNPDKGNQNLAPPSWRRMRSIAPDGDTALWNVAGGAPGGGNGSLSAFIAERTDTGWQSRSLAPPADEQIGGGDFSYFPELAAPDHSQFLFRAARSTIFATSEYTAYLRLDRDQNQDILSTYPNQGFGTSEDMTDDASHVLLIDPQTFQLVDVGTGTPEVVSLMPEGTPSGCGLELPAGASFTGGTNSGTATAASKQWRLGYHMIATTDASRVYFQAKMDGNCNSRFGIYVRNRDTDQTTMIDPAGGEDATFIRASADGRTAYFATYSQLDDADTNNSGDVYRWDESSGESTCLTCVVPDANLLRYNTGLSAVMVSDDFSHIYFTSRSQLVPDHGTPGKMNLYVLSDGEIRFVSVVGESGGSGPLPDSTSLLSTDGNTLLFESEGNLTADAQAPQCQAALGFSGPCRQLYRYDDSDGSLECLSCRRDGVTNRSVGSANDRGIALSSDGSTAVFATSQALVPRDVNGTVDVYEWRNGALGLITDGVTEFVLDDVGFAAPQVLDTDADGSNIFFSVAAPGLTGFEEDDLSNLYDARIGGGFSPPSPPTVCTEDACQGPIQPPPSGDTPGSSTFLGPGNPPPIFPRHCSAARRRVRLAKRRLRRADTAKERRRARAKLRRARRRLRICLGGAR